MANEQNLIPAKKGEVRNPKGKPKGTIHLSTRIKNMLEDESFEQKLKDGTILKGQPIEAILKVAIAKARTGDIRFLEWLAKYGYGTSINLEINDSRKEILLKYGLGEGDDAGQAEEA
jgi:hypothetical protein